MTDQQPGTPCPQCHANMVLQYSKNDPHITQALHSDHLRVPMRCCRCGINVVVSVDPKKLEAAGLEPEDERDEDDTWTY